MRIGSLLKVQLSRADPEGWRIPPGPRGRVPARGLNLRQSPLRCGQMRPKAGRCSRWCSGGGRFRPPARPMFWAQLPWSTRAGDFGSDRCATCTLVLHELRKVARVARAAARSSKRCRAPRVTRSARLRHTHGCVEGLDDQRDVEWGTDLTESNHDGQQHWAARRQCLRPRGRFPLRQSDRRQELGCAEWGGARAESAVVSRRSSTVGPWQWFQSFRPPKNNADPPLSSRVDRALFAAMLLPCRS